MEANRIIKALLDQTKDYSDNGLVLGNEDHFLIEDIEKFLEQEPINDLNVDSEIEFVTERIEEYESGNDFENADCYREDLTRLEKVNELLKTNSGVMITGLDKEQLIEKINNTLTVDQIFFDLLRNGLDGYVHDELTSFSLDELISLLERAKEIKEGL